MRRLLFLGIMMLALAASPAAFAAGGNYVVDGGTPAEQAQVADALNASAFPWGIVEQQIAIHIARGSETVATMGTIWIDADVLDAGSFSWGVVQHEYAHEVDYFLLDDAMRGEVLARLGGESWWQTSADYAHGNLASERFASTLAWAYWPSALNSMAPAGPHDESAAMPPAAFRAALAFLLGRPGLAGRTASHRKALTTKG